LVDRLFKSYGAKRDMFSIHINSRKFIDYVMGHYLGLDAVQTASMIRLVDRMHKMDRADFIAAVDAICSPSQREAGAVEKLLDVLSAQRFTALPPALQTNPSLMDLAQVIEQLQKLGITNAEFDVTLMRGFDYYTDIVFEVFDTNPNNNRAIMGGGRYDG